MAQFEIEGVKIYYEINRKPEKGEAVAFFNGIMSSVRAWDGIKPVFEDNGYAVLLHDFRGQLLSDKPEGQYTFSLHARDAKALFDELGIAKVHILGTSYGGIVGLRFAIDFPEYVKSLTLVDSTPELDRMFRWIGKEWIRLSEQGDIEELYDNIVPIIHSNTYMTNREDEILKRRALLSKVPGDFMSSLVYLLRNTMDNTHFTRELKKIKAPTLIICGDNDLLCPLKFSKTMDDRIPDSEFVIIPDCGHASVYEEPGIMKTLAMGFVAKNSSWAK